MAYLVIDTDKLEMICGDDLKVVIPLDSFNNAVVQFIQCKDCKWYDTSEDECGLSGLDTDGYEYCSWAERREK